MDQPTKTSPTPTSFTDDSSPAMLGGSRRSRLWLLLPAVGLLACAAPLYMLRDSWAGAKNEYPKLATEPVKRNPFRILVTERGTLASSKNATLSSGVEGTTTIISIIPEGTAVHAPVLAEADGVIETIGPVVNDQRYVTIRCKEGTVEVPIPTGKYTRVLVKEGQEVKSGDMLAGDVCCELDSALLVEKEIQQQILVTNAEALVKKATENVEIQKLQNQTDVAAAQLALTLAELDLVKFEEGDQKQSVFEIEAELKTAQQNLAQQQENYEFVRRNALKGFQSQNQLESARIAMEDARLKVEIAEGKLRVLQDFTNKRTLTELKQMAADAKLALERVTRAGSAALAQFEADLSAAKLTLDAERAKLIRFQQQIAACRLVAPQDGKVVYANQRSRRSEPVVIEEGATVRERQAVIYLPDFSQMKVDVKIHESKISPLREGQPARIKVDALPNKTFRGTVSVIPDVPVPGDWPNTDLMLYPVEVKLTDEVDDLKPGMTADVQIVVDDRSDVLQVPVQSIVAVGDQYVAWVLTPRGPELRDDVKIGKSNDAAIEILSGLEEGERVVMNPRSQFADQLAELELKYGKAARQPGEADPPAPADAPGAGGPKPEGKSGGQAAGGRPGGGPPGGGAAGRGAGFSPDAIFQRADKNGDGKISKDEFSPNSPVSFESLDADADGGVTLEEMKQSFARRAASGGGPPGGSAP